MGVSLSATAAIGVRIPRDKLWADIIRGAAAHGHPNVAGARFCSACGDELAKCTRRVPWPGQPKDDIEELFGFEVVESQCEDHYVVLAYDAVCARESRGANFVRMPPWDLLAVEKEMRARLEPHGLWNGDEFGIWAINHGKLVVARWFAEKEEK